MATYYVDQTAGNDGATGLVGAPWKTMAKLGGASFSAGDTCLLKCGEVWRETWYVNTGGSVGSPVTYGTYSTGAKPKVTGCDLLTGWTLTSGSIYQATYNNGIDTFLLLQDDAPLTKMGSLGAVVAPGQFWPDDANDTIYAWCTDSADPDTHVMEIGARYDTVNCDDRNNITFNGIHFHGAGGQYGRVFGCKPTWNTPSGITLDGCEVSRGYYTGVAFEHADTFDPLSNIQVLACEVHHNQTFGVRIEGEAGKLFTGVLVDGCDIHDNGNVTFGQFGVWIRYCTGPTITDNEISDSNGYLDWSDNLLFGASSGVVVTGNLIHGGNHSAIHLDVHSSGLIAWNVCHSMTWNGIWVEEHQTGSGDATTIYHNTCYHNLHGLVFGPGSTIREVSGVTVKNNVFALNRRANVELNEDGVSPSYLNNTLDYNCYQTDPTPDPLYEGEFRAEPTRVNKTFAQWKTYTSWDANSLNVVPLLKSDYTLSGLSPCKDAGVVVGGIGQVVIGTGPDIGRYEYTGGYVGVKRA